MKDIEVLYKILFIKNRIKYNSIEIPEIINSILDLYKDENVSEINRCKYADTLLLLGYQDLVYQEDISLPKGIPLSKNKINKIKTIKINEINIKEYNKINCSICMEQFKIKDKIMKLNCDHIFHDICLIKWLNNDNTCPNCRNCIN